MSFPPTAEEISAAYQALLTESLDVSRADERLQVAESELEDAENIVVLGGLDGKNEATRKAQLAAATIPERVAVEKARTKQCEAERRHISASIRVREISALLKLAEIQKEAGHV